MQLAQQDHTGSGAALVAKVGSVAVSVVEPEPIFATAEGAWPVLVGEKPGLDAELWQNLAPAVTGALDSGAHHATRCLAWDLAWAICRLRTHDRTSASGTAGSTCRQDGHSPNFSRYLCAAQPR